MASGDAFLHGSAAETYGLVVAEALCSGLPVIVPDMGGAADLAGPHHAEVYETGNAQECANAIIRMLKRDKRALKVGCADISKSKIGTMGTHFEQLFELYESMVNERAGLARA